MNLKVGTVLSPAPGTCRESKRTCELKLVSLILALMKILAYGSKALR